MDEIKSAIDTGLRTRLQPNSTKWIERVNLQKEKLIRCVNIVSNLNFALINAFS